jgi:uncharacterized protein YidB (DUF937 family)
VEIASWDCLTLSWVEALPANPAFPRRLRPCCWCWRLRRPRTIWPIAKRDPARRPPQRQAGGLGGLLAASGASGALGSLVDLFHQNGHGPAINSWISQGPNQQLEPAQVGQALGPGPLQELEQRTGLPQQTLLEQLARELPAAIDHVTPQGRLPTDAELAATLQARPQT